MARVEPRRTVLCQAALMTLALLAEAPLHAQVMPASPIDVRYTPVQGSADALHPRAGRADTAPAVLREGSYAANADVARLLVEVDRDRQPADGQSPVHISLHVFGRDGQALRGTVLVTLEHSGGRLLLPGARTDELGPRRQDADRVTPGVQLAVHSGRADFTLLAPAEPQDVRLRVTAGGEEASGVISFVPELRPMIASGLVEGIVNLRHKIGIEPVRRGDAFEREIERWSRDFSGGRGSVAARTAFYLKGTVRGDLLLTAAYDSDKDTRTRLLRDIRPDELYPVYGDASLRSFDARSAQRLYLRVDKDKSYVLYGDFVTGDGFSQPLGQGAVASLKQRSLGQYNRTATGARLHHEAGAFAGNVWALNDSLRQVVEEFASQGSGPYGLRNNAVLEASEKVEVVVRDRRQPSRIISVQALARLVDYSFEPFSGRILLTQFLASVDADLNPVSLRVTYEVDQGGPSFWVAGADAQVKLTQHLEVGGSAVEDRNALAPYRLGSANLTWRLGERSALVAELASSRSEVNSNPTNVSSTPALASKIGAVAGNAWRVELVHEGDASQARVFAGRSSPLFNNPAAPLNGGRGELLAQGSIKLTDTLKLYGEGLRSEDRNPGGSERSLAGAGLRWQLGKRWTLEGGLRSQRETIGTQGNSVSSVPFGSTLGLSSSIASGSGGGALGLGSQALDPVSGLPLIGASALPAALSNLVPGTRLASDSVRFGIGFKATERLTLGAEVEHEVSGDDRRRIALGADWLLAERTRAYGRLEHQTGWASLQGVTVTGKRTDALVLGIDSSYLRDTQTFSELRLRDAFSGRDMQVASGVRNTLDLHEGLRLSTAVEHTKVVEGSVGSATGVAVGLDWSSDPLWRASTRVEWRHSGDVGDTPASDESFSTTLWQGMVARKLNRNWTLLARDHYLRTDFASRGGIVQNRAQLGLAWRETDRNRINALGKIEHKSERDASNASVGTLKTEAWIVSAHADWHASRPWWATGRAAAKWQRDRFEGGVDSSFQAQLLAGRVVYDITENWDLGLMAAAQFGQRGALQHALGVEAGYLLRQNLWLSAGVNANGFRGDADLVGYEYTQRGVFIRLRFKFDETLFKRADRDVNRSLDR